MSDRIDFHEIRKGNYDDYNTVCLVKTYDLALEIMELLIRTYKCDYFIEHVELVAYTNLEMQDY